MIYKLNKKMTEPIKSIFATPLIKLFKGAVESAGIDLNEARIGELYAWKLTDFDIQEHTAEFTLQKLPNDQ